jgi:AmmeMemoRadiSam system protein B
MRRSVVAGRFYPGTAIQLRDMLHSFFDSLGGLPEPGTPHSVGGLSPHAGYEYSGQVAAYTFAEFRKCMPETFVVLGPNHTGLGSGVAIMTSGSWETPLGEIKIDEALAKHIHNNCDIVDNDVTAHAHEHSIEVQLPFIQYIGGETFVPISMGMQDQETSIEVGTAIAEAASDRKVGIVASSDLTHFGAGYGFQPVREEPLQWMERVDKEILAGIEKMSPETVYAASKKTTACGYGCISAMITACEKLGLKTPEILEYRTSYDVSRDTSFVVGYGAAVIK